MDWCSYDVRALLLELLQVHVAAPYHSQFCESMSLASVYFGGHMARPPTPKDIPEPSLGGVFREKLHSVYVVNGV